MHPQKSAGSADVDQDLGAPRHAFKYQREHDRLSAILDHPIVRPARRAFWTRMTLDGLTDSPSVSLHDERL
jgi:hypothetical protein